ncbi:RNA ligase family protein [Halopenitus persicus]|uniref:RNA ligase family protein n=1 Tax=Halopenitus persicus TaxID=1048396 RepID=UPI000BBA4633|nr:RNA ligase family protein [Halopenitus persicus]
MHTYPSIPHVENAPAGLLEEGHLWLLEHVDGAQLRFQLRDSGAIRFGDRNRVYRNPAHIPAPYRHAVRHVRERLDRRALREAVANVEDVTVFGEATHRHAIDYDWERTPSFLGFDVRSGSDGEFLPPDAVERVLEALGLAPVHAVDREVRARDFDPDAYTVPQSAYYDGPAAGIVIRDKAGRRAVLPHPEFRGDAEPPFAAASESAPESAPEAESVPPDADAAAARYATRKRLERIASRLEKAERTVTVDALYDRVLEDIDREHHHRLHDGSRSIDMDDFRAAVAARTRRFLDDR